MALPYESRATSLRALEADHAPDGWPAVQMRDISALLDEVDALRTLCETLKQEAQIHAQESRTQRSIVHACYRAATGGTGEPGNWHGAKPVEEIIDALRQRAEAAEQQTQHHREVLLAISVASTTDPRARSMASDALAAHIKEAKP